MKEKYELENRIQDLVSSPNYQPLKPRGLAKKLKITDEADRDFKRALKRLIKSGRIVYGDKHLVLAGKGREKTDRAHDEQYFEGRYRRTASGFGFVTPTGTPRSAGRDANFFIAAADALDAANGDLVAVKKKRVGRGSHKRGSGRIVEVLDRHTHRFVGTYFEDREKGYVRIDNQNFEHAVSVGDPGAKNAQPDDKVVIDMVHFPSARRLGEGVIVKVLGDRGAAGVDTQMIIYEFGLPGAFDEEVLEDARSQAERFDESIGPDRTDHTDLTVITIDPFDARDFDDAISLEQQDSGHWLLGVHIADVSHFVPPKSQLDHEARERATSIYLPDRVIPMLPEIISNNLASLQPDTVRYTKTAFLEFTSDGILVDTSTCSAAIRSKRRFDYEEVDDYLKHPAKWKNKLTPAVHQLLGNMHQLAMILRKRRWNQGALELTMREVKLDLDKQGRVAGAHAVEYTESHQIIEEFMLSANIAVAEMLRDKGIAFLRRIHENPDPRKLKLLTDFLRQLKFNVDSMESRFEIQRVLTEVKGQPEEFAVNYAVLRSLQKAVYSPSEEGHYALASDCYCHFTSPIRRYPDLTVHRLLDQLHRNKKPVRDFEHLVTLGQHCSEREQRAESAERELIKLKLLGYMSQRIGEQMHAVVTGVESFGLFVRGLEIPAEGLIPIASLPDDHYDFDANAHSLSGRRKNAFRLGDEITVEVAHVDMDRRELDFRVVPHAPLPSTTQPSSKQTDSRRSKPSSDNKKPDEKRRAAKRKPLPETSQAKTTRGKKKPTGGKSAKLDSGTARPAKQKPTTRGKSADDKRAKRKPAKDKSSTSRGKSSKGGPKAGKPAKRKPAKARPGTTKGKSVKGGPKAGKPAKRKPAKKKPSSSRKKSPHGKSKARRKKS